METLPSTPDASPQPDSAHRILEAALTLFAEKGFEATSIREICEAAGIARPSLYYFYESKEGLYRAAIEQVMRRCDERAKEARGRATTFREGMQFIARSVFADVVAQPRTWKLIFQIAWSKPHAISQSIFEAFHAQWSHEMEADQAEAVARGELAPGDTAVRSLIFMGTLGECFGNYLTMGRPELTPELADSLVEAILEGWTPRKS